MILDPLAPRDEEAQVAPDHLLTIEPAGDEHSLANALRMERVYAVDEARNDLIDRLTEKKRKEGP
jgi:hypothetical protein